MQHHGKKELILDAMQELMKLNIAETISVSDIAKKAGIGKGSIYYYFPSKNDIIEAVIERSYSVVIEKSRLLASDITVGAFAKMELIFKYCLDASIELKKQEESGSFSELLQSALIHQKYISIITRSLKPILAEVLQQGVCEGEIICPYPEEISEIILIILTTKIDNHILPSSAEEIQKLLDAFSHMQEKSMGIKQGRLDFLKYQEAGPCVT